LGSNLRLATLHPRTADIAFSEKATSDFVLGTAQLGMLYGRVNDTGQPSRDAAVNIVRSALARGVTILDTARVYGSAEAILGKALSPLSYSRVSVITKLNLSRLQSRSDEAEVLHEIDASIEASCRALQIQKLNTVLLHDWKHHDEWNGAAWRRLCQLQERGKVEFIGASVYTPPQALEALDDPRIQHLQIPINILDRRWKQAAVDQAIARRPELVVHARSVFLQGILVHSANRWPKITGFDAEACVHKIAALVNMLGRSGPADLCLAYLRSLSWITGVVIGCETFQQLEANLNLFSQSKLLPGQILETEQTFQDVPEELLNPSRWSAEFEPVLHAK
jgi:aryl-alcohol dehydrogenase-like predicted oxidoreductase